MATLATLIATCAISTAPGVHDALYRVTTAHSGGSPHHILDESTGAVHAPADRARAVKVARALAAGGKRVRVGLTGLPVGRIDAAPGFTLERALDPCDHIAYASLELEAAFLGVPARSRTSPRALHRVLARFYDPGAPDSPAAIFFGARVLSTPPVDVSHLVAKGDPGTPADYDLSARSMIRAAGAHTRPRADPGARRGARLMRRPRPPAATLDAHDAHDAHEVSP